MDIDLLRTFLEVRRLGNFRSASENLHVSQAAVSQRIKHLESMLNSPLFIREKNNIYTTPVGEQLAPAAESIIATWAQVRQEIGFTPQVGPILSLAAKAGAWDLFGNSCLPYLHATWPVLSFKADILSEELIVKRLLAQVLDLAFLVSGCELEYLKCEAVASFELALHSSSAKTLEQASLEPYVYVEWGRDVAAMYSGQLGFEHQPRLHMGDHLIARDFLENNGGSAFLPVIGGSSKSGLEVIPDSPRIRREIFASWHKKNPSRALIDEIVAALQAVPAVAFSPVS